MKFIFFFAIHTCCFNIYSQTTSWIQLCKLDQQMSHSSGILTLNEGLTFWTQVDNSSPEELYEISPDCQVLRTLKITNIQKTDWEDIANDDQGNIYIGDFGNNNNDRTNLKIYILKNVNTNTSDKITAQTITFSYANQNSFPPPAAELNFDMESMIWYHDSLHLFSKNRTNPFTGYTYQYSMPTIPGNYKLSPVDSFKTGAGPTLFFWITGAAINRIDRQLILLSHDRIWMFTDFESSRFFQGKSRMITLPNYTQKEGICHAKENTWYLTDEFNPTINLGGNLYEMKLDTITNLDNTAVTKFEIYPNPVQEYLSVLFKENKDEKEIKIYDILGNLCLDYTTNQSRNTIPIKGLVNGIYFIQSITKNLKSTLIKKLIVQK